ncbi:MAG: acyl-CoA/acyl-ACP dehydrogenase [Novosphingobium sp.]|nr:acyl-CoA/acyl-ACP dehydrogenase [Novosphingobium sp.]
MIDEDDLQAFREGIARVLEGAADRTQLHAHLDGELALDRTLWEQAAELGWLAIGLPEEAGGLGFGAQGLDILHRELGRCAAPGPFIASLAAAQVLAETADSDVKDSWLPRLASGEAKLAVAARIADGPAGKDSWLLGDANSDAALIPLATGDWGLVGLEGGQPVELWDRTRSVLTADIDSVAPLAVLDGEATSRALTRHLCLAIASDSIGAARAITEITVAYMKEREQFGKPIASFQALKHRVADMMTMIVAGEELVSLAVQSADAADPDADIWSSLAKVRASDIFVHVSNEALQMHGGVGFTWEFDVHAFLMRSRLNELLVAHNHELRDRAADGFAQALEEGRQVLELAL